MHLAHLVYNLIPRPQLSIACSKNEKLGTKLLIYTTLSRVHKNRQLE